MKNDLLQEKIEKYKSMALATAARATLPPQETLTQNLDEFLNEYTGSGILKIEVTSGNSNIPVKDAAVEVLRESENTFIRIYKKVTDESGIVDNLVLPALPASLSQIEETANDSGTVYIVTVNHPLYEANSEHKAVIYDKVKTILPVALQPKII